MPLTIPNPFEQTSSLKQARRWGVQVAGMLAANVVGYVIGLPTTVLVATILGYGAIGSRHYWRDIKALAEQERRCARDYPRLRQLGSDQFKANDFEQPRSLLIETVDAVASSDGSRRAQDARALVDLWRAKWRQRFAATHNCSASAVQLGILGTLFGGSLTVAALAAGVPFEETLVGMSVAFMSSVAGAAFALLLGNWATLADARIDELGDSVHAVASMIQPTTGSFGSDH